MSGAGVVALVSIGISRVTSCGVLSSPLANTTTETITAADINPATAKTTKDQGLTKNRALTRGRNEDSEFSGGAVVKV